MYTKVHPLYSGIRPPRQFTYPFFYEPHPLCTAAAAEVQRYVAESGVWQGEQSPGKMFGVLVVEAAGSNGAAGGDTRLGFLAAYSGLLAGRNDWPYFVPPVFDAQSPDGHFKRTEREISAINREISDMENSYRYGVLKSSFQKVKSEVDKAVADARQKMVAAKARRDERRREAERDGVDIPADEREVMVRESQYLKAELRRVRQHCEARLAEARKPVDGQEAKIGALRRRRREMSDALQLWLFSQYRVLNANGEERDLIGIFRDAAPNRENGRLASDMPPAGAGDCCAPKLLQYAYAHGLRPVCMAEFWWGESPRQEIRHHMRYYPACRSKCLPILTHMLRGLDVEPNPLDSLRAAGEPRIVYEDDAIVVVDKPAGMPSVPGKTEAAMRYNVEAFFNNRAKAVHRLDMDTSGLLVLARTDDAYVELQRQFAAREVRKRYEALLDGTPPSADGIIDLPLIADITDRPRQRVDPDHGKSALTDYHVAGTRSDGTTLVYLYPHTGRTHQLRVHCAHACGLGCPILGDPLYGRATTARRMYLHAAMVEFRHPVTGERLTFESPSGW